MLTRSALGIAVVAALALSALPAAAQPGAVQSGVYLHGDPPQALRPGLQNGTTFTVEYQYQAGVGQDSEQTQINIDVLDKPEWAEVIVSPDRLTVPVEPTQTSTTEEITVRVRVARNTVAFDPEPVTLHVEAERNGAIRSSNNTFSWHFQAAFVPDVQLGISRTPIVVGEGEVETLRLHLENRGNADIRPSFRLSKSSADIQIGVGYSGRVVQTPLDSPRERTMADLPVLIKPMTAGWDQELIAVQMDYRPTALPNGPVWSDSIQFLVLEPSLGFVGNVLAPTLVGVGLVAGAVTWYHRRDKVPLPWERD